MLKDFFSKHKGLILVACFALVFIAIISAIIGGVVDQQSNTDCGVNDADNTTDVGSIGGAGGSWTKEGTVQYKVAQQVYNSLTKDLGLSGAAACGVMGNIAHESGFWLPATNRSDGGKGLIQWTHGREAQLLNFAKKRGKHWTDLGVQIDMLEHDLKNPALWVSGKYRNNSLRTFGRINDPAEAASRFYISGMEAGGGWKHDPDGTEPKRRRNAMLADKLFNKDHKKANGDKLGSVTKSSASTSDSNPGDGCDYDGEAGPGGDWNWPFKSIKGDHPSISGAQLFGHVGGGRPNGFHCGVDFGTIPYGNQSILAIHGGTVYKIGHWGYTQAGLGWYVCVKSDDGFYEIYQEFAFADGDRNKAIKVKVGDKLKTGDPVAVLNPRLRGVTHIHIGVSRKEIMAAEKHAFTDDGTWINWIPYVIKSRHAGNSAKSDSNKKKED